MPLLLNGTLTRPVRRQGTALWVDRGGVDPGWMKCITDTGQQRFWSVAVSSIV